MPVLLRVSLLLAASWASACPSWCASWRCDGSSWCLDGSTPQPCAHCGKVRGKNAGDAASSHGGSAAASQYAASADETAQVPEAAKNATGKQRVASFFAIGDWGYFDEWRPSHYRTGSDLGWYTDWRIEWRLANGQCQGLLADRMRAVAAERQNTDHPFRFVVNGMRLQHCLALAEVLS